MVTTLPRFIQHGTWLRVSQRIKFLNDDSLQIKISDLDTSMWFPLSFTVLSLILARLTHICSTHFNSTWSEYGTLQLPMITSMQMKPARTCVETSWALGQCQAWDSKTSNVNNVMNLSLHLELLYVAWLCAERIGTNQKMDPLQLDPSEIRNVNFVVVCFLSFLGFLFFRLWMLAPRTGCNLAWKISAIPYVPECMCN